MFVLYTSLNNVVSYDCQYKGYVQTQMV